MRAVLAGLVATFAFGVLAGCAELGVVGDGTSVSVGKPNGGYLVDGARLPDHGTGFLTRDVWIQRDNRYATDEMIELVEGVARRMHARIRDVSIVIADLSSRAGGGAFAFHRSHQSGRDADFLYYMRDADGKPFEPDAMHVFDGRGHARDKSGLSIDVPRTWLLVRELVDAPEAPVQYIFMYEPIAKLLLDHARDAGEPEAVIARARKALKQPGDSARHDDHMHVRIYRSRGDRAYGCVDIGPMDLLAEREAQEQQIYAALASRQPAPAIAAAAAPAPAVAAEPAALVVGGQSHPEPAWPSAAASTSDAPRSLLRTRPDWIPFRGWR